LSIIGTAVTLQDVARRLDANGKIDKIVEMLTETNEILQDMRWIEGNLPTGHKTTVRTGLPQATWRKLNYGVPTGKSTTAQITDTCGMLETYAEVDKALADLNGNTAEFRLSEDRAFLEGMNQQMAETLFYGDTAKHPERFIGLAPRYNSLSADSGKNIVNAGGTGDDNTSIWLVCWGDNTAHGIYPKGSKAGFQHQDLGEVTLEDGAGGKYQGYRTHYKWDCGLTVRDWRYISRIANISVSNLAGTDCTAPVSLIDLMIDAYYKIPNMNMGKPVFYCNRTILAYLHKQVRNDKNVNLYLDNVEGKPVVKFLGIPIRQCDQIKNTETRVA
jgi:hypothetical protein